MKAENQPFKTFVSETLPFFHSMAILEFSLPASCRSAITLLKHFRSLQLFPLSCPVAGRGFCACLLNTRYDGTDIGCKAMKLLCPSKSREICCFVKRLLKAALLKALLNKKQKNKKKPHELSKIMKEVLTIFLCLFTF